MPKEGDSTALSITVVIHSLSYYAPHTRDIGDAGNSGVSPIVPVLFVQSVGFPVTFYYQYKIEAILPHRNQ